MFEVSNETGQCIVSGQEDRSYKDRSYFIVPGQRYNRQAQNLAKGWDGPRQPVLSRPAGKNKTMQKCLISQDCPHGEVAFSTSMCIYNVNLKANLKPKEKLVKLQYVISTMVK